MEDVNYGWSYLIHLDIFLLKACSELQVCIDYFRIAVCAAHYLYADD